MKTIAVVLTLCIVGALGALTDEQKARLKAYKESCLEESGADPAGVESAKNGNIPEKDEKLDCFGTCMLKKIGIMNPDGTINIDVIKAKAPSTIPEEKLDAVINTCKVHAVDNTCSSGGNVMRCLLVNKNFSILH